MVLSHGVGDGTRLPPGGPAVRVPRAALVDVALLALACALALGLSRTYVSAERTFYFWDFGAHQDLAVQTAAAFGRSPDEGLQFVGDSLDKSYNALFAVPLVPLMTWWGSSRVAYEQALSLVCFLPLPLSVGALAARVARGHRRAAFWTATGLTLSTPMAWIPTLRGFPDSLPASLVGLALLACLSDPHLERRRTALTAGALLALATLLRRHFAYAVLALGLLLAFLTLRRAWRTAAGGRLAALRQGLARLALLAASGLTTAGLLGPGFLRRLLAYDFGLLQEGYETPIGAQLRYFANGYGLLMVSCAAVGLWLGLRSARLDREAFAVVAAFGALQALQWLFFVRQIGEQYSLHLTPTLVLCTWALAWSLPTAAARRVVAAGVGLVAVANLWLGLNANDPWTGSPARRLAAANWPPRRHPGYEGILGLVSALRASPSAAQPVFVAASSFCLNPDIVRRADAELAGASGRRLDVQDVPAIDSEGAYPLGQLIDAGFVVLGVPLQLHLPADRQQVVRLGVEVFERGSGIASDFAPWPSGFTLGDCSARVFERRRPTRLETALAALGEMQSRLPARPGQQADWIQVERTYSSWLERLPGGSAQWTAHPTLRREGATRLASLETVAQGDVTGQVRFNDSRCPGVTLELAAWEPPSTPRPCASASLRPGEPGTFRLAAAPVRATRLLLSLWPYAPGSSIDYCMLVIDDLALRRDPRSPAEAGGP